MVVNNNPKTERTIMATGVATRLIALLIHGEPEVQLQTAATLMCLVDRMVGYLDTDDDDLQKKGTRAIIELSAINAENRHQIVSEGALPHLVRIMRHGSPDLQAMVTRALGNIMLEGNQYLISQVLQVRIPCEIVVMGEKQPSEEGPVQILSDHLDVKATYTVQAESAYALKNIAECQNSVMISEVLESKAHINAITVLKEGLNEDNPFAVEQICGFLAALCENNNAHRKVVGQAAAVPIVSELLFPAADKDLCGAGEPDVFGEAIRTLKNLSMSPLYKEAMSGGSMFDLLRRLYDGESSHPNVVRDAKDLSDFLQQERA